MPETIWGGLLFIAIGALLFFRPDWLWKIAEQWKSYGADEPSELYRISTRAGGACLALFGVAVMVLPYILE